MLIYGNKMQLILIVILIGNLNSVMPGGPKMKYCGQILTSVRLLLCSEQAQLINNPDAERHSTTDKMITSSTTTLSPKNRALAIAAEEKRKVEFIVQCCYKSCTMTELLTYC